MPPLPLLEPSGPHAADCTGHTVLYTLYDQCTKQEIRGDDAFQVLDLITTGDECAGVVAYEILNGEIPTFHAKQVCFAVGKRRAARISTNRRLPPLFSK